MPFLCSLPCCVCQWAEHSSSCICIEQPEVAACGRKEFDAFSFLDFNCGLDYRQVGLELESSTLSSFGLERKLCCISSNSRHTRTPLAYFASLKHPINEAQFKLWQLQCKFSITRVRTFCRTLSENLLVGEEAVFHKLLATRKPLGAVWTGSFPLFDYAQRVCGFMSRTCLIAIVGHRGTTLYHTKCLSTNLCHSLGCTRCSKEDAFVSSTLITGPCEGAATFFNWTTLTQWGIFTIMVAPEICHKMYADTPHPMRGHGCVEIGIDTPEGARSKMWQCVP